MIIGPAKNKRTPSITLTREIFLRKAHASDHDQHGKCAKFPHKLPKILHPHTEVVFPETGTNRSIFETASDFCILRLKASLLH